LFIIVEGIGEARVDQTGGDPVVNLIEREGIQEVNQEVERISEGDDDSPLNHNQH
jgi:hypothetical protein